MKSITKHLIQQNATLKDAVKKLEVLKSDAILFLVDNENKLIGSLTDGDIRRAILNGKPLDAKVDECIQNQPILIEKGNVKINDLITWRENQFKIIPFVDKEKRIIDILNFKNKRSMVPVDCVIMAGGKGERLNPLTEQTPKPLLPVGNKPIIEHGIDHYSFYGIQNIFVTTNYLSDQLVDFIQNKKSDDLNLQSIKESEFMGTMGSIRLIDRFYNNTILVTNSDLLTNVDIELFYLNFIKTDADCCVLSVQYQVEIPFGVLQEKENKLEFINEKPTYSYKTNGGMYMFKRELIELIPSDKPFSAVDFIELLLTLNKNVSLFQHFGYWLDIGNHNDYNRAQQDIYYFRNDQVKL